jgi:hypothetical protein
VPLAQPARKEGEARAREIFLQNRQAFLTPEPMIPARPRSSDVHGGSPKLGATRRRPRKEMCVMTFLETTFAQSARRWKVGAALSSREFHPTLKGLREAGDDYIISASFHKIPRDENRPAQWGNELAC